VAFRSAAADFPSGVVGQNIYLRDLKESRTYLVTDPNLGNAVFTARPPRAFFLSAKGGTIVLDRQGPSKGRRDQPFVVNAAP